MDPNQTFSRLAGLEGGQKAPETDADKASKTAPETEGTKTDDEPFVVVPWANGESRRFSPTQIKSTMERYGALNAKHARMKPVMSLAEKILEAAPNATPEQVAQFLGMAAQSFKPQQKQQAQQQQTASPSTDEELERWEKENAAKLPPGYRELHTLIRTNAQQMNDLRELMQQTLQATRLGVGAAKNARGEAEGMQIAAMKQAIGNNLDAAQKQLGFSDDQASDFLNFAQARGYTIEDFIDPDLTLTVANDFKANMNGPEMERLRAMAKRREAATGTLGSSPGGAAGGQATDGAGQPPPTLNRLIDKAQRGQIR